MIDAEMKVRACLEEILSLKVPIVTNWVSFPGIGNCINIVTEINLYDNMPQVNGVLQKFSHFMWTKV